ncbi:MAG: peptide chain release factor 1 [Pseudomonadota bacterium]
MFDRLQAFEERYHVLEQALSNPETIRDQERFQKLAREHSELSRLVQTWRAYKGVSQGLEENKELLSDPDEEMRRLAREEMAELKQRQAEIEGEIRLLLIPKDPNDAKNILLEVRAGTGGDEAGLFAAELFGMYSRYAETRRWKVEVLSHHPTGVGGFKEIIALIQGQGAYSQLKYESGVQRVQRVPATENQGRIHTSTVTVAVMPEAEEVDVQIAEGDLRIDVFRSSGPGGQSVNTTDSAVRVTHLPTGLVVTCQDEKSQHKNKAKALKVLRARLLDRVQQERHNKIAEERKSQVGTGERSERIRTYNFPQGRVTDHRIGLTLYKLEQVLAGDVQEFIDSLIADSQTRALKNIE